MNLSQNTKILRIKYFQFVPKIHVTKCWHQNSGLEVTKDYCSMLYCFYGYYHLKIPVRSSNVYVEVSNPMVGCQARGAGPLPSSPSLHQAQCCSNGFSRGPGEENVRGSLGMSSGQLHSPVTPHLSSPLPVIQL